MPISYPTKPQVISRAYRGITVWLMLMILAGCSTQVRTPFEVPEPETALPAAEEGPLTNLEQALPNSLASQEVVAVNSHYKAWRGPMLDAGFRLYEARHDAAIKSTVVDTAPVSAAVMGLHSKSMVIDRRLSVIRSANF